MLRGPDLLDHPRHLVVLLEDLAGTAEGRQVLEAAVPSGRATLQDVDDAGLVAEVGVVVHGEEVAELVERQFLRVAQPLVIDLDITAVRVAAEDGAGGGVLEVTTLLGGEVVTPVADRPVQPAIGSPGQSVHVVTGQTDADAEAVLNAAPLVGDAVRVRVFEDPDVGNASQVDLPFLRDQSDHWPVEGIVELVGVDDSVLGHPITVAILQSDDPLGVLGVVTGGILALPLLVHRQPVFDRLTRDVIEKPKLPLAVVVDSAALQPVVLGHVESVLIVEADRGGVLDLVLVREESDREVLLVEPESLHTLGRVAPGLRVHSGRDRWGGISLRRRTGRHKEDD